MTTRRDQGAVHHMASNMDTDALPIPSDWSGGPGLIAFFVPLPVPVGLPDGFSLTMARPEVVDWLRGMPQVIDNAGSLSMHPEFSDGSNIVSVKVHRPIADVRISTKPFDVAIQCIDRVLGRGLTVDPADPDRGSVVKETHTVFEAVTPLLLPEGQSVERGVAGAFDRVMEEVATLFRAVAYVSDDLRVRAWVRDTVYPAIPYLTRSSERTDWGGVGIFLVNASVLPPVGTQELEHEGMLRVVGAVRGLKRGDPAIRF